MFYPNLIKSIRPSDKVLEIGPGASPYSRANEFLEYKFSDPSIEIGQRGNVHSKPDFGGRKVTYYEGIRFPFEDNEFDYVIASHVVEHTALPEKFLEEVFRVGGGRGYIEYPLPPYEYLYDFDVHLSYFWFDKSANELKYIKKRREAIEDFSAITKHFRKSLELGWDGLVANNLENFIEGFEFSEPFGVCEVASLKEYNREWKKEGNTLARRLVRKLEKLLT